MPRPNVCVVDMSEFAREIFRTWCEMKNVPSTASIMERFIREGDGTNSHTYAAFMKDLKAAVVRAGEMHV